jgi:hypothetical protein
MLASVNVSSENNKTRIFMKLKGAKKLILILIITPFLFTCGKNDQSKSSPVIIDNPEFQFKLYDGISESVSKVIYDSLTKNKDRITGHLRVSSMPEITVSVWSSRKEFEDVQKQRLGTVYPGSTGYINGMTEMFLYYGSGTASDAVHELAHLISLALNPDFGNRPRWLWEAVAIYESRESVDISEWSSTERIFPGFTALNQFNSSLPYKWGYPLAKYILDEWGDDGYINLILTNGNIKAAAGINEDEFISEFQLYMNSITFYILSLLYILSIR